MIGLKFVNLLRVAWFSLDIPWQVPHVDRLSSGQGYSDEVRCIGCFLAYKEELSKRVSTLNAVADTLPHP